MHKLKKKMSSKQYKTYKQKYKINKQPKKWLLNQKSYQFSPIWLKSDYFVIHVFIT